MDTGSMPVQIAADLLDSSTLWLWWLWCMPGQSLTVIPVVVHAVRVLAQQGKIGHRVCGHSEAFQFDLQACVDTCGDWQGTLEGCIVVSYGMLRPGDMGPCSARPADIRALFT